MCGGTLDRNGEYRTSEGLSPRVRGNLSEGCQVKGDSGSIPACAGEPRAIYFPSFLHWVYPRVCGGTGVGVHHGHALWGLSPRVRGNRIGLEHRQRRSRSIPACAGEPITLLSKPAIREVYPRVCGGTASGLSIGNVGHGLSPRGAGEPITLLSKPAIREVYPRVCGGTYSTSGAIM